MRSLQELAGTELFWTRLRAGKGRTYGLLAGEEVCSTLRREKAVGSLATGEAAEGAWTVKRVGFLRPRVTVRAPGSEVDLAVFTPGWSGDGTLEFPDGRRFHWKQVGFWRQEWGFQHGDGRDLLQIRCGFSMSKARLTILPGAAGLPELSLLCILGWYLLLLMAEDLGATAAVIATS